MPADASSTSGEPADQTTGEQVDGSTSGEIDEASSTGDTSTGEIDGTTSGSTGDGSTSTGSSGGDTASSTSTGDTGSEAMLEPVGCAPAAVGVNAAFTGAIQGNCGCHGGGAGGLTFNDMASFKAATVNVMATNADMQRITPGDINESYLLYKLHGQQLKVPGGGGSQMPFGGPQLSDTAQCLMINWVKGLSTAKALGEMCVVDDECESGACIGSGLEDFNRCSTPCTLDAADDCSKQGHPGICLWSGGDQHYCGGSFPTEATFFGIATPPPPNSQPWSTSGQIANPSARHFWLIPAWSSPFFVKTTSLDFGPHAVDIIASNGTVIESLETDVDHFSIAPQGVDKYHWLVLRPLGDKSHYAMWLDSE